jgi:hypothetical protein
MGLGPMGVGSDPAEGRRREAELFGKLSNHSPEYIAGDLVTDVDTAADFIASRYCAVRDFSKAAQKYRRAPVTLNSLSTGCGRADPNNILSSAGPCSLWRSAPIFDLWTSSASSGVGSLSGSSTEKATTGTPSRSRSLVPTGDNP